MSSTQSSTSKQFAGSARATARQRILRATAELIEEKGPQAITVRDITARASSSNTTLVKHFGSKDGLFASYVINFGEHLDAASVIDPAEDMAEALTRVGQGLLETWLSGLRAFRSVLGAINNDNRLGVLMSAHTYDPIVRNLAGALEGWAARGLVESTDFAADAERFMNLLKAGAWYRNLLSGEQAYTPQQITDDVGGAVRVFLRGIQSQR